MVSLDRVIPAQQLLLGCAMGIAFPLVAACSRSASTAGPAPLPQSTHFILSVSASHDSALKLARFALGTIDGSLQLPQVRPKVTTISTHYARNRRGGGHRQVAIIVAIDRQVADTTAPVTLIELAAFKLDLAQPQTEGQRRSGFPTTPLSSNAPALRRALPITPVDTTDWKSLHLVIDAFVKLGARRQQ